MKNVRKHITAISVVFLLAFANSALCSTGNHRACNDYAQAHAIFGEALEEGIKQLTGNKQKKGDIKITPLLGGLSSANLFIITIDNENYVIRSLNTKHCIDIRRQEVLAHTYGAKIGIAPPLLYVDDNFSFIIMPFVKGYTLNSDDLKKDQVIKKIAHAISKLHKYSGNFSRRKTQVERARKHYDCALTKQVALPTVYAKLFEDYVRTGDKLTENLNEKVLCHADLNPSNIIVREDGEIFFIDWTSATLDNQYTDLGYFSFTNGLSDEQALLLLTTYLGKEPTKHQLEKFEQARQRTSFLTATVWFDFSESDQDKLTPYSERVEHLDSLLMSKSLKTGNDYLRDNEVVSPTSGDTIKIRLYALGFLKTYINWVNSQDD